VSAFISFRTTRPNDPAIAATTTIAASIRQPSPSWQGSFGLQSPNGIATKKASASSGIPITAATAQPTLPPIVVALR
jgi:hypothetical protein